MQLQTTFYSSFLKAQFKISSPFSEKYLNQLQYTKNIVRNNENVVSNDENTVSNNKIVVSNDKNLLR